MFLNLMPAFDLHTIRWTGTLQRIAIVFFISAIIYLNTNWKQQAWITAILLVGILAAFDLSFQHRVMIKPCLNLV